MENSVLLSTSYFAPIPYYSIYVQTKKVFIEQYENYTKQTFRNRCVILGANGPISLIVPVVKSRGPKILMKDLRISYDTAWQRNHWRTIFSAYNSSPYFDYFKDEIFPIFEMKEKFILDFNLKIHETVCDLLEIENTVVLTNDFEKTEANTLNLREVISPKNKLLNQQFQTQKYTQVFSDKIKFTDNLSILDLLFCEGPNSYSFLEEASVKF
ncbi:MAG: WbqC family protein [Prolixibacteraceae bacterium]|nr:WbqC family protein [Prolixibacteraceae bacterium]